MEGARDVSMYSKEHYEDIAIFVAELPSPGSTPGPVKAIEVVKRRIAERLADRFAADNPGGECPGGCGEDHPGFDRERFLAACGLEPEPNILAELEEKADHWEEGYPKEPVA